MECPSERHGMILALGNMGKEQKRPYRLWIKAMLGSSAGFNDENVG
jgi:hypothetical protein